MSFLYKIIVDAAPDAIPHSWHYALEIADTLVPITSLCFCIEGIFLVLMLMKQVSLWTKAYHLKLVEILEEFLSLKYFALISKYAWLPFSSIISQLEFRLIHEIFCEEYNIQSYAFQFDLYVHKLLEKFLLDTIEIRPVDWLFVITIVFLNWGRNKLDLQLLKCDHGHADGHADEECESLNTIQMFTILGTNNSIVDQLIMCCDRRCHSIRSEFRACSYFQSFGIAFACCKEHPIIF